MLLASRPADAAASSESTCSLPAIMRAQAGYVRGVVAAVPLVNRQRAFEILAAIHGMNKALLEVQFRHGFQQCCPALVQCVDEHQ